MTTSALKSGGAFQRHFGTNAQYRVQHRRRMPRGRDVVRDVCSLRFRYAFSLRFRYVFRYAFRDVFRVVSSA